MKKVLKMFMFVLIFVILFFIFSYLLSPKYNLKKFGFIKNSLYSILSEKPNTIDVVAVGDSLVYSSISPMEIYGEYGYTVFDCSKPAQLVTEAYNYYKVAVESQKPKVAFIEANILFRNINKKSAISKSKDFLKSSVPLMVYHNNWKKIIIKDDDANNNFKGFVYSKKIKPGTLKEYMVKTDDIKPIPKENLEYLNKIIELSKENNIKLIFVGLPSQKSWNYAKHNAISKLSKELQFEYINLNMIEEIDIDWQKDTRDKGDHLNYFGAKKVSKYLGEYLKKLNIISSKKNDSNYNDWNMLYEKYKNLD